MYSSTIEMESKRSHDPQAATTTTTTVTNDDSLRRRMWVPGPIIVGGGPSGLATAACLKQQNIPSMILEKEGCIASLWQLKTYDRLRLHLPKHFCQLPFSPFPKNFPTYPTREQFVDYLAKYAEKFDLKVALNRRVRRAEFDSKCGVWVVRVVVGSKGHDDAATAGDEEEEYRCRWLVVASGENADAAVPEIEGIRGFGGPMVHSSGYRSGELFRGKRVLVIGCGNSGMEVSLDLCHYNASPFLVVRDSVHILPQEMVGGSTFGVAMRMVKWGIPVRVVDRLLLVVSHLMLGDTARLGLHRPKLGPLQLKNASGKTPVLDVGTLSKIRTGHIKVRPGIKRLVPHGAEFVDGKVENFDAVILATGYKSNVPSWLKESDMFSKEDGLPKKPFPNGWKGKHGLYAVGFTNRGLSGASMDATRIAEDIAQCWKTQPKHLFMSFPCTLPITQPYDSSS